MQEGKKLLLNSFWSSSGWSYNDISDEVFQTCKAQGYMFDPPEIITHDEYMKRLAKIVCSIDPNDVAGAFLYSLSTRSLEYRSALGSYWYAVAVPNHQWPDDKPYHCPICGWHRWSDRDQNRHSGFNVLNFERYKWGGVRHTKGQYALFDLEKFLLLPKVTPTDEDIKLIENTFTKFEEGTLEDEKGYCAVATTEDIEKQDYILTPGRYVGIEEQEDDGEPFEEKMARLTSELSDMFVKSHELEDEIRRKLGAIGYEI